MCTFIFNYTSFPDDSSPEASESRCLVTSALSASASELSSSGASETSASEIAEVSAGNGCEIIGVGRIFGTEMS